VCAPHDPERGVMPGVHVPARGAHHVVFWDPHLLPLADAPLAGVSQEELLVADRESGRDQAGLSAYEAHRAHRVARTARAATPSYRVRAVTADVSEEPGPVLPGDLATRLAAQGVTLVDVGATRDASVSGKRFGRLVHALFEYLPRDASREVLSALAYTLGRTFGASEGERAHAVERVARALAHPFWKRIEAVCIEPAASGQRVLLVDFKTDAGLGDGTRYARQLEAYARALALALEKPVERVLLWV